MGIQDFYQFVKDILKQKGHTSYVYPKQMTMKQFITAQNQTEVKIAVDGNAFLYNIMYSVYPQIEERFPFCKNYLQQKEVRQFVLDKLAESTMRKIQTVQQFGPAQNKLWCKLFFIFDGGKPEEKLVCADRKRKREDACQVANETFDSLNTSLTPEELLRHQIEYQKGKKKRRSQKRIQKDVLIASEGGEVLVCEEPKDETTIAIETMSRNHASSCSITAQDVFHIHTLLQKQEGVFSFISEHEADPVLATLTHYGGVDYVAADDSDILISISKSATLVRDFFSVYSEDYGTLKLYSKAELLSDQVLGIEEEKLAHMCAMFGCDYLERLPKVGPKTIWAGMRKANWDLEVYFDTLFKTHPQAKRLSEKQQKEYKVKARNTALRFLYPERQITLGTLFFLIKIGSS